MLAKPLNWLQQKIFGEEKPPASQLKDVLSFIWKESF